MSVICRKAQPNDVDALYELIQDYAAKGIMLPRSREALTRNINNFVVAQDGDKFVGCGSLLQLGSDLVEIRSLGIADGYKGQGIGSRLVDALLEHASALNIPKVMALTYEVHFFEKNGFHVVDKEIFPEKVWTDCVNCPKQQCCDEIAVVRMIEPAKQGEQLSFAQI
ncbi:N-acetyltransferase [Cohnella silvisoli]|uniref:N-acetyltransferase n=1 Tax=Cohnella silvisoli TaxID=2873699 RepID=A0ABV1KUM8_9BACL|nr:N-acetyltransferase [Cohnella silvisoli]MCD9023019.1 N-acetyltransferase [Cohnella silvisoli]